MTASTKTIAFSCGIFLAVTALAQTATVSSADQKFIDFAAQTDMTEAHVGQMAQDKGTAQGVKDFGQTLTTDHTNDYQQLSNMAAKISANVPKGIDAMHDHMIAPFDKAKGAAFDRSFVREMVSGHEKAIAEYKREINDTTNADVKTYANTALPVLEKHLQLAKDLAKSKGK